MTSEVSRVRLKSMKTLLLIGLIFVSGCAPVHFMNHAGWVEKDGSRILLNSRCSGPQPVARSSPFEIILRRKGEMLEVNGSLAFKVSLKSDFNHINYRFSGGQPLAESVELQLIEYRDLIKREANEAQSISHLKPLEFGPDPRFPLRLLIFKTSIPFLSKDLLIELPDMTLDGSVIESKRIEFQFVDEWRFVSLSGC